VQVSKNNSTALPAVHLQDQTSAFSSHIKSALVIQFDDAYCQAMNSKLYDKSKGEHDRGGVMNVWTKPTYRQ